MKRQRIIKSQCGRKYVLAASANGGQVCRRRAYNFKSIVLFAIAIGGVVSFQGTKSQCDDLCVALRMENVPAEVVRV